MKTALITGASAGLGLEFTKIFASEGYDLIIIARNKAGLDMIAAALTANYEIEVRAIQADLSDHASAEQIYNMVSQSGVIVDVLVNNAGSGRHGLFAESSPQDAADMISLNVTTLTLLTNYFLKEMIERGSGKILNVSSLCAFQPNPLYAVYGATKAYELTFTKALATELTGTGVTVSALCPGPTKTEFASRAGRQDSALAADARSVAQAGFDGMMRGKLVIIPGLKNRLGLCGSKLLPQNLVARIIKKWQENLRK